jgi:hypothetical protein
MAEEKDPRLEIEKLADDDLEAVSGGDVVTAGGAMCTCFGTCNTAVGTCNTAVGAVCNTTGGTCSNGGSENPLPEGGGAS